MTIKAVGLFAGGPAVGGAGRVQQVREGGAGQEDHPAALPLPEQGPLHTPPQQDRHHSQVIIWPVINCLFFKKFFSLIVHSVVGLRRYQKKFFLSTRQE